jgi:hypothetical protein
LQGKDAETGVLMLRYMQGHNYHMKIRTKKYEEIVFYICIDIYIKNAAETGAHEDIRRDALLMLRNIGASYSQ